MRLKILLILPLLAVMLVGIMSTSYGSFIISPKLYWNTLRVNSHMYDGAALIRTQQKMLPSLIELPADSKILQETSRKYSPQSVRRVPFLQSLFMLAPNFPGDCSFCFNLKDVEYEESWQYYVVGQHSGGSYSIYTACNVTDLVAAHADPQARFAETMKNQWKGYLVLLGIFIGAVLYICSHFKRRGTKNIEPTAV